MNAPFTEDYIMNKIKGFTIIELLIVIAIIGIVFAIAAPILFPERHQENIQPRTAVSAYTTPVNIGYDTLVLGQDARVYKFHDKASNTTCFVSHSGDIDCIPDKDLVEPTK